LKAAIQAVDKAHTELQAAVANGSTDPRSALMWGEILRSIFTLAWAWSFRCAFLSQPGNKLHTKLDITATKS